MLALRAYAKQDPSRLVFEEAATPTIGTGDVLVRVHASGVSPGELDWPGAWLEHDGSPRVPPIVPGHELAGVIEAVGSDVDGLAVGDEVFGYIDVRRDGADAEYVAVGAHELARTPTSLTAAEASAVPLSALTAWQAFFDHGGLTAGYPSGSRNFTYPSLKYGISIGDGPAADTSARVSPPLLM